jgi:microsomal epoxide hydrolase
VKFLPALAILLLTPCLPLAAHSPLHTDTEKPPRHEGYVTTPDKIRIHYIAGAKLATGAIPNAAEAEKSAAASLAGTAPAASEAPATAAPKSPSILFVPGWTMPAWIWDDQLDHFEFHYRVVAMDPRCQGRSTCNGEGLYPAARARDIKAVIDRLQLKPVVLVGWSMAVNEIVSYVDQFGTSDLAGLVFVDDSTTPIDPKDAKDMLDFIASLQSDHTAKTNEFVRSFFKKPQTEEFLKSVVQASLDVPPDASVAMLVGKFGADLTPALEKIDKPSLAIASNEPYKSAIQQMAKQIKGCSYEEMDGVGHALFVDDPNHFNSLLDSFLSSLSTVPSPSNTP